jgi:hypothetical protein
VTACQTLPLADFGTAVFTSARAVGVRGHAGSIASRRWSATKIKLTPGGRRFVANQGDRSSGGSASPSALEAGGTAFTVTFSRVASGNPFTTPRATGSWPSGRLYH